MDMHPAVMDRDKFHTEPTETQLKTILGIKMAWLDQATGKLKELLDGEYRYKNQDRNYSCQKFGWHK